PIYSEFQSTRYTFRCEVGLTIRKHTQETQQTEEEGRKSQQGAEAIGYLSSVLLCCTYNTINTAVVQGQNRIVRVYFSYTLPLCPCGIHLYTDKIRLSYSVV
ncbi:unnamed protein product, partial [Pylaiella littoralis]